MLRTSGRRQTSTGEKIITGNAATDSAFLRLAHVLREIAESAVNGKEEATGVKSYTRVPKARGRKILRKGGVKCHR